jgi:tripartite-type tricarboxylate transporter receptor subunit TctC
MPVSSARELAELSKQKPVSIAITGVGAISHLGLVLFQAASGAKIQGVPYRGAAQAVTDILGGQLDGVFADVPTILTQVRAGKLKPLAATSSDRSEIFPDVPTFVEQGFAGTVADQWAGLLAPAATPAPVIAKLHGALTAALDDAEVRRRLAESGVTPWPSTPDWFARYLREEIERWGRVVRERGIKG